MKIVILLGVAIYSSHGHPRPGNTTGGDCTCKDALKSSKEWNPFGSILSPDGCLELEISQDDVMTGDMFKKYVDAVYKMANNQLYNVINKTSDDFKKRELTEGVDKDLITEWKREQLKYVEDAEKYYKLAYPKNYGGDGEHCTVKKETNAQICEVPICEDPGQDVKPATPGPTSIFYMWTQWGEWSDCDCQEGTRLRKRKCTDNGSPDEPTLEIQKCFANIDFNKMDSGIINVVWGDKQDDKCHACPI